MASVQEKTQERAPSEKKGEKISILTYLGPIIGKSFKDILFKE